MFWHIETDVFSLVIIGAIYVYCLQYFKQTPDIGRKPRNRRFLRCLHVGTVATFADIIASLVMEFPTPRLIYHIFMTLYFIAVELVNIEWFLYVMTILYQENEKRRKIITRVVRIVYEAYILFNIISLWTGWLYTLGENNKYSRGPLFSVPMVLFGICTAILFILTILKWKKIPKEYSPFVLLLTPTIVAISVAVQLSYPGLLLIMPAFTVCLVLAFLYFQMHQVRKRETVVQRLSHMAVTDQLTGLLNRAGLEELQHRLWEECAGQRCAVILADIDDLKSINDTLGHTEGDHAISAVGAQLRCHFCSADILVRYGGDEFLVIALGCSDRKKLQDSLVLLNERFSKIRLGAQGEYTLHGSIGAIFGVVGTDDFQMLCSKADAALYDAKRAGKNRFCLCE